MVMMIFPVKGNLEDGYIVKWTDEYTGRREYSVWNDGENRTAWSQSMDDLKAEQNVICKCDHQTDATWRMRMDPEVSQAYGITGAFRFSNAETVRNCLFGIPA